MSETGGHWAGSEPDGWDWVDDTPQLKPGLDTFLFLRRACRHLIAHHLQYHQYAQLPCLMEPWLLTKLDFDDWQACAVIEACGMIAQATARPLDRS